MNREQIFAAVELTLRIMIERKMDDIPMWAKPMLKNFSPENIGTMLQGELTEDDWIRIEALFKA